MKLAKKLLQIREALGLSQNGLIERLELPDTIQQRNVSAWETGYREPNLLTLTKYAKAANICLSRSPLDFARNNAETAMNRAFERLFVQRFLAPYLACAQRFPK